jgi:hypothetical protein
MNQYSYVRRFGEVCLLMHLACNKDLPATVSTEPGTLESRQLTAANQPAVNQAGNQPTSRLSVPQTPPSTVESAMAVLAPALAEAEKNERGNNDCERALNGLRAVLATYGKQGGIDAEKFIKGCQMLPPNFQMCLRTSYARANVRECEERKKNVDPKVLDEAFALMKGR